VKISEKKIRKLIRDEIDERKLRKNISSHISEVLGSKAVAKGRRSGSSSRGWRSSRDEPEQEEGGPAEGEIGTIIGSKDTKSLAPDAQPVFNEFISKANAAGYNIKITSARRVPSHQWQLKYVTPSALTPAKPCRSDHQYGYALDINASYTDDNGKKKRLFSKSSDREWKPLVDIANSVGLRWQGSADRVHFSLGSISNDTKAKCTKFYTDNIGSIGSGGKGTQAMKDLEQGPKNAAIRDILKIPDMAMFAESKASMVIKKVAESSQMERIAESVVRDAISNTNAHKYKEVDHIHITVTEERRLHDLIRNILSEDMNEVLGSSASANKGGRAGGGRAGGGRYRRSSRSDSSDDLIKGERKDAKTMSISAAGLQRIKKEEGYRDQVYDDDPSQDIISSYEQAVGYPTIGVGHLVYKAGSKDERAKYEKYLGGKEKMTPAQVDELLATDIDKHTRWKNDITEPITQNMFDALADFAFNAGNAAPKQDGILAAINKGDFKGAAAILKTARGGGAGGSHASRRREEAELFLA